VPRALAPLCATNICEYTLKNNEKTPKKNLMVAKNRHFLVSQRVIEHFFDHRDVPYDH
jgi:hypothetical protein